jgi:hypothetical protein
MSRIYDAIREAESARKAAPLQKAMSIAEAPPKPASPPTEPVAVSAGAAFEPALQREKRRSKRVKLTLRAGVRRADMMDGQALEIVATENSSRGGLCFQTVHKNYFQGRPVFVVFPYTPSHDHIPGAEQSGHVSRVEAMPDGKLRVTIAFGAPREAARRGERRTSPRSELSAMASLQEDGSATQVQARVSELSLGGCYIDTLNPLQVGTRLRLRIQRDSRTFESLARVCSSHRGAGMGLFFEAPSSEQVSTLVDWLSPATPQIP